MYLDRLHALLDIARELIIGTEFRHLASPEADVVDGDVSHVAGPGSGPEVVAPVAVPVNLRLRHLPLVTLQSIQGVSTKRSPLK